MAVPIANPRAGQSFMRRKLRIWGPIMAPRIPVVITRTAVSDGRPPSCSVMPMATGAVTDLGARETSASLDPPSSQAMATADTEAVSDPVTMFNLPGETHPVRARLLGRLLHGGGRARVRNRRASGW